MHSQCHQDIDDLTGLVACLRPWGQGTPPTHSWDSCIPSHRWWCRTDQEYRGCLPAGARIPSRDPIGEGATRDCLCRQCNCETGVFWDSRVYEWWMVCAMQQLIVILIRRWLVSLFCWDNFWWEKKDKAITQCTWLQDLFCSVLFCREWGKRIDSSCMNLWTKKDNETRKSPVMKIPHPVTLMTAPPMLDLWDT